MKRGVNSLASIAVTAPLIGFIGTTLGMAGSFKGMAAERSSVIWPFMARDMSASLAPTAIGILVAVLAFCFHGHLLEKLDNFDVEMQNASLALVDGLSRL
jgi:biopolymer transport protein ExbB